MNVKKAERVMPTPETVAKLKRDYLSTLDRDLQETAGMIECAFRLLCAGVLSKPQKLQRTSGGKSKVWTDGQNYIVVCYQTWADEMGARKMPLDACLDMIVDATPPWRVDAVRRWREGHAAESLLEALRLHQSIRRHVRIEGLKDADMAVEKLREDRLLKNAS